MGTRGIISKSLVSPALLTAVTSNLYKTGFALTSTHVSLDCIRVCRLSMSLKHSLIACLELVHITLYRLQTQTMAMKNLIYIYIYILKYIYIYIFYNQQGIALRRRKTQSNRKILKPKSYTLLSTKDRKMQSKTIKE